MIILCNKKLSGYSLGIKYEVITSCSRYKIYDFLSSDNHHKRYDDITIAQWDNLSSDQITSEKCWKQSLSLAKLNRTWKLWNLQASLGKLCLTQESLGKLRLNFILCWIHLTWCCSIFVNDISLQDFMLGPSLTRGSESEVNSVFSRNTSKSYSPRTVRILSRVSNLESSLLSLLSLFKAWPHTRWG